MGHGRGGREAPDPGESTPVSKRGSAKKRKRDDSKSKDARPTHKRMAAGNFYILLGI